MKILKYKWFIAGSIVIVTAITACKKDFLNRPPLAALNPSVVANKQGVEGLLIGAYALLDGTGGRGTGNWASASSNWTYGSVAADDAYKGSDPSDVGEIVSYETWTINPTTGGPNDKWNAMYDGIQRANEVLRVMALATDVKPENQTLFKAESRFLRAFYHFELKKMFNMVPYVDETVNLSKEKDISNAEDIWPQIEADLQFAIDSLPETQSQAGRVNKWAAMSFLATAYLY